MEKEIKTELRVIKSDVSEIEKEAREKAVIKKGHSNPLYKKLIEFSTDKIAKKFSVKDVLR